MAKSNKPLIWLPFAAGGTIAAFLLPAMALVTLLAALGLLPDQAFAFERMRALVDHPLGKLGLLVVLALPLWHAAHRLRMTLQDLGVREPGPRRLVARLCYTAGAVVTVLLLYTLWPA
ncbi:MAG: fumarate reductase subunit FrdD [Planctomycetota bacterium]